MGFSSCEEVPSGLGQSYRFDLRVVLEVALYRGHGVLVPEGACDIGDLRSLVPHPRGGEPPQAVRGELLHIGPVSKVLKALVDYVRGHGPAI